MTIECPKIQETMNQAYDRWQEGWSKQDFWEHLSRRERIAVAAGNMNYQVENGGFMQWHDNGYATVDNVRLLRDVCVEVGTEAALAVDDLLRQFEEVNPESAETEDEWEETSISLDPLDRDYYAVNERWMHDLEAWFARL